MNVMFEALDRNLIYAQLSSGARSWIRELQIHQELDSTNSYLMRRVDSGIDRVVCLAEVQTHGRGRRGRTWLTPAGRGIALSLGRKMHIPLAQIAPLSLVAGLAVADALRRSQISLISLKWPNDVLLNGAKAAGVLVEVAGIADPNVVIGVGINMGAGNELASQLGFGVGDVLEVNQGASRNGLVAALLDSLVESTEAFEAQGFEPMREAWERLHAHQDQAVQLLCGAQIVCGIARGVTSSGELKLETDTGIRCFSSGEVSLRMAGSAL